VAGGSLNAASGDFSFVAERQAKNTDPTHDGVFMFADSQNLDFFSAGLNTFNVRAQGGMHLNSQTNLFFGAQTRQMLNLWNVPGVDNYGIGVQAGTLYFRTGDHFAWFRDGVHHDGTFHPGAGGTESMRLDASGNLSIRGAFGSLSDRTMKTDFTAVNSQEVLEQIIALPIQNWRYKHDQGTRHIGPVAQDFYAAFAVRTDDKHIATVDADGVAFAAIQGLYRKGEQENAKLRAENAEMKVRLAALEAEATKHERTHARVEVLAARFERMFQARAGE
jgi:trimeric autotransporter adhesin